MTSIPSWAVKGAKVDPATLRHGHDRPGVMCACGDHAFGILTRGFVALVSPEDIGVFNRKWGVRFQRGHVAAMRTLHPQRTAQLMHRLIVDAPEGKSVDHINGDSLDNRRGNLRLCDQAQNSWNRGASRSKKSGLPKGVSPKRRKFAAAIKARGVSYRLGNFDTPEEAHAAYAAAAKRLHGEFARVE